MNDTPSGKSSSGGEDNDLNDEKEFDAFMNDSRPDETV